jgi:hypothetical protein
MRRLTIVSAISVLLFACSAKEPPAPDANQAPVEQAPAAVSVADVSTPGCSTRPQNQRTGCPTVVAMMSSDTAH